jgi:phosphoribosylformimino-5-aminoimidazole carboxamide ribonucleotide (ProFAR) isomerase
VPFDVLPAIDVAGGRLVFASRLRARPVGVFAGSATAAARAFVDAGAGWLHVVDVDRALGREPDLDLLRDLCALGARVQTSGGIGSAEAAGRALEAGATRVVLSSSVLRDPDVTRTLVDGLGDRGVVGIEADADAIRPRSGGGGSIPLAETLAWLATTGARRYLFTAVSRVAALGGADVGGVARAAVLLGHPMLVAGGIRGLEDVSALKVLGPDVVEGVVIGRALYEGLDLSRVLAAAR